MKEVNFWSNSELFYAEECQAGYKLCSKSICIKKENDCPLNHVSMTTNNTPVDGVYSYNL